MLKRIVYRPSHGQRSLLKVATRGMVISALTLTGLVVIPAAVPSAVAAVTDGKVTVRVVQAVNANGTVDSTILEPPLIGVAVTFTDAAGHIEAVTTDTNGLAVLDPAVSTLTGGEYRVDVANPKPGTYEPGFAASGQGPLAAAITLADLQNPANVKLSSNTEFVDVSAGQDAYVNTSFWYPPYYCQENAAVCDAVQPWDAPGFPTSPPGEKTLISAPYRLDSNEALLATKADTGAVYGIAYDRDQKRIFSAAYAKRGSAYGPGGPGAIYVTDLTSTTPGKDPAHYPLTGTTSLFATVTDAGVDNHAMSTNQDYGFFDHVGKESLGDIDVTNDNRYLFGVNMFDKTAFVYDLSNDSYVGSYEIPSPCTLNSDWRPMGVGVGLDTSYIGGVCTGQSNQNMAELSAHVYQFDPATGSIGTHVIDQSLTYGRGLGYTGAVCKGGIEASTTGRWFSWLSRYPTNANEQRAAGCGTSMTAYPTPMLGDIVEETNGDLVIAFRDRFADQSGRNAIEMTATGGYDYLGDTVSAGDLLRGCKLVDGTFVLDPNYVVGGHSLAPGAVCDDNNLASHPDRGNQPSTFSEYYVGDWRVGGGQHQEMLFAGIALSRVEPNIVSSGFDVDHNVWVQGIAPINRDGSYPTGKIGLVTSDSTAGNFGKGSGLADLEVLCDQAPLQIGNRVWLDVNKNGVQDPAEPFVAGVTVNLYDSDGGLVGTTTTSAYGNYYFDDWNVGGLQPNTTYTVKLDNPADYAEGGPLFKHVLTQADAGSDDLLDSDGVVPNDEPYPAVTLTTGGPGQNNHSYDFGFVVQAPAVAIQKYDTVGGRSDGDANTVATAAGYEPGESRTIAFDVTNSGNMDLAKVTVTDQTITGGTVTAMSCAFPGETDPTAGTFTGSTWTVVWAASHANPPTAVWAPGATFACSATLTLSGASEPHADSATVAAVAAETGEPVSASDDYHAFTGAVQLVKYDGRDGFVPTQDTDGIPQKPLVVGAGRDANTAGTAVDYVVMPGSATTGPYPVRWAVTNTGTTWLGDISITDQTLDGPTLTGISCNFNPVGGPLTGATWFGPWAPGSTFYCQGELTLDGTGDDSTHGDLAKVTATVVRPETNPDYDATVPGSNPFTDQPQLDGSGDPVLSDVVLSDDDPFYAKTLIPANTIAKGDGNSASNTISHEADTMSEGEAYAPGETRDVILNLNNSGETPLYDVTVTDVLTSGDTTVRGLSCVFPGQVDPTAGTLTGTTWTVFWHETFEVADGVAWLPGQSFSCSATLTMAGSAAPHANTATVTSTMSPAGVPGDTDNPPPTNPDGPSHVNVYNAYTGDIQVIKYDGNKADPAIGSGPSTWTVPAKPLVDANQDANDAAHAVSYPVDSAQPVTWVVTNTGATWLANITLTDTTDTGPDVGAWTCDLSGVGGTSGYSFTESGPWPGPLAPSASFFCTGPLTLPANTAHADTVEVVGTVVQPLFNGEDQPILDDFGVPMFATGEDDLPVLSTVEVVDEDAFHAQTVSVTIIKGDGSGDTIVNDADTMDTGAVYDTAGQTRTIVTVAGNPSPAALHDVVLTDITTAGVAPTDMSCDFPDGTSANGSYDSQTQTWTVRWAATFAPGEQSWQPTDTIVCHSELTLNGQSDPHRDLAQVDALTPAGALITANNPYNAFSGDIQVIKYDGNKSDPNVGTPGAWAPPAKPLRNAGQDANDAKHAVGYTLTDGASTGPQTVRWVVTNTGKTWLTNVVLSDVTEVGPSIASSSTTCTFPDGTEAGVVAGAITWRNPAGVLFEPGASFFCQGTLTLGADQVHADHVDVAANIVPPAVDEIGNPTDQPSLGLDELPKSALNPLTGTPWSVTDSDAFHASSPAAAALAATGVNSAGILQSALALLVAGLMLLLMGRRIRSNG